MDIISEQFVQLVIMIVEINNCKLLKIDTMNHIFDITGPTDESMLCCAQMMEEFQHYFFKCNLMLNPGMIFN